MRFNKLASIGLVIALSGSILMGCGHADEQEKSDLNLQKSDKMKITMITDSGGINEKSFNRNAWDGMKKAKEDLDVEVNYIETKGESDYNSNIKKAIDSGADLIIGTGYKIEKAIEKASKENPNQKFALIDADLGGKLPKNVESVMFKSEEAAYLVGLVAGKLTETNKVGFIGGEKCPEIESFQAGYIAGVNQINPEVEILSKYADSFENPEKGKSLTDEMITEDVDIIFHAAGDTGKGVIQEAKDRGKKVIGVDVDQNEISPETIITSAIKRVDIGVYDVVKNFVDGKFNGGKVIFYSLNEDGMGLAPSTKEDVSPDVLEFINSKGDKIKRGEIKVPSSMKDIEEDE